MNNVVKLYRNLTNGLISIQQNGLVVGHAESVTVRNPQFKVGEGARQRVIRDKEKNVHAFLMGDVVALKEYKQYKGRYVLFGTDFGTIQPVEEGTLIKYNPYLYGYFYTDDGIEVDPSQFEFITVRSDGVILAK